MSSADLKIHPSQAGRRRVRPGRMWVWARRSTQALALIALLVGPLLGGWQRLDYARERSQWNDPGWDLAATFQQNLPVIASSDSIYRANRAIGGGIAAELFAVPLMDPLAGALALLGHPLSWVSIVALGLPVALGLLGGRIFCGWFCSFGILARTLDALTARVPWARHFAFPQQRRMRWLLLIGAVAASLLGSHLLFYLMLPYLLLQQSFYAAWLLGGGGAILGVLTGLLVAGLAFGPTAYCATLCPTGAVLSLLGRRRRVHLTQASQADCGRHCDLCHRACWLQLDPRAGDPGPDCDLCGRCVPSCPSTNLVLERARRVPVASALALLAALSIGAPVARADAAGEGRPTLLFEAELRRGSTTIAASAIDMTGAHSGLEWLETESGVDVSLFIGRGDPEPPGADGIVPSRDSYRGPLRIEVLRSSGERVASLEFDAANHPVSAQRRRIYRRRVPARLEPGDRIVVAAVPGWFEAEVAFEVPHPGTRTGLAQFGRYAAVSTLVFGGLLSLALVDFGRSAANRRRTQ
jgi:ferredoxin-type protein NapH